MSAIRFHDAEATASSVRVEGFGLQVALLSYNPGILKYPGLAFAALTAAFSTIGFAQTRTPPREIVQVKGDLYRAGDGNWYTVFLVTPAGIILGDPINESFAPWLKGQLDTRFPGRPVRYVVYSHSHFDHASGGAVFAGTATFVGHVNMLRNMDGRYPQMPGDMIDRNDNGVIDRDEIDMPTNTRPGVCGMFPGWFDSWPIPTRTARSPRRSCSSTSCGRRSSTATACASNSAARWSSSCIPASTTPTTPP